MSRAVTLDVETARALLDLLVQADAAGAYGKCEDHLSAAGGCTVCTVLEALQCALLRAS